jgi:hypothetical protein
MVATIELSIMTDLKTKEDLLKEKNISVEWYDDGNVMGYVLKNNNKNELYRYGWKALSGGISWTIGGKCKPSSCPSVPFVSTQDAIDAVFSNYQPIT